MITKFVFIFQSLPGSPGKLFAISLRKVVPVTHEHNITCSKTHLDDTTHKQTIILRQLYAGNEVGSWPMEDLLLTFTLYKVGITHLFTKQELGKPIHMYNIIAIFNFHSLDVVRAYKNLLQEKEALEASVTVLTTSSNQTTKNSSKKEAADGKAQSETVEDVKKSGSAGKGEVVTSPVQEESIHTGEVLDHPLAVREDYVEHGKQLHQDEVYFFVVISTQLYKCYNTGQK